MPSLHPRVLLRSAFRRLIPGTVALLWLAAAQAAPTLAGPSVVRPGQAVTFTGQGYQPNAPVSIALNAPGAAEAHFGAVVGADGSVSYRLAPSVPGRYMLRVMSADKTLSTARFEVMP